MYLSQGILLSEQDMQDRGMQGDVRTMVGDNGEQLCVALSFGPYATCGTLSIHIPASHAHTAAWVFRSIAEKLEEKDARNILGLLAQGFDESVTNEQVA